MRTFALGTQSSVEHFGLVAGALFATVKERTPTAVFTVGALSFRVGLASALVFLGGAWVMLEFVGDEFTRRAHVARRS